MGNPLVMLKDIVDFEQFRNELEKLFTNNSKKNNAGRKPIDPVFMLKVLFLQRLYNISDNQVEYQIKDRMSFREFLDIQSVDDVPDENIREEYKMIKEREGRELWNDNPHKKRHKDVDARWTKKGGINYYGYKDHTLVIEKTKMIKNFVVTPASVHDSTPVDILIDGRIEHVYGFMEQSMKGLFFRGVGIVRATFYIGFTNLVYNMYRLVQIMKYHPDWIMN